MISIDPNPRLQAKAVTRARDAMRRAAMHLRDALRSYEDTGDHNHGRGTIAPGGGCVGGDCIVDRTRKALSYLEKI